MSQVNVREMLEAAKINHRPVKISAPMVRYSRLAFRELMRKYGTELCYTPMMLADSFVKSQTYRDAEYFIPTDTELIDQPVIAQFAATDPEDFAGAAELSYARKANGIDLNCGCPQRWAWQEGIGVKTMHRLDWPQFVSDLVKTTKRRVPSNFSVSIKVRLFATGDKKNEDPDYARTLECLKQAERAGVDFIAVHGRTRHERNVTPHYEMCKRLIEDLDCPVVINGGFKTKEQALTEFEGTECAGLMVAQQILKDPDFWYDGQVSRKQVIRDYLEFALLRQTPLTIYLHHLLSMTDDVKYLSKKSREELNSMTSFSSVVDFLNNKNLIS